MLSRPEDRPSLYAVTVLKDVTDSISSQDNDTTLLCSTMTVPHSLHLHVRRVLSQPVG